MSYQPSLAALAVTLMLAACGPAPQPAAAAAGNDPEPTEHVAPPLLAPGQNTDSVQPASYEVSIAGAAAEHNKALTRCTQQPEAVRSRCEEEANAAFAEVRENLEPLRGNQE